jgi:transposase InsO family protein
MLRDIQFTLRTDHANLTYVNKAGSDRVFRWKLAFQEYSFDVLHIKGPENLVADLLSRQVEHPLDTSQQEIPNLMVLEHVVIPNEQFNWINRCHNSKVGHHGVERTIRKLLEKHLEWDQMRLHVRKFIRTCPCCQKMKQLMPAIHTNPYTVNSYHPWDIISMDTLTGLPQSAEGYTGILVIIDNFSRYIELYPVKSTTEKEAIDCLIQHIGRYGIPAKVVSDNGTQFIAKVITELMQVLRLDHQLTIAYSKEENSIVERSNKEILRHLRALIFEEKVLEEWVNFVPLVQRIINATVHSATNIAPSKLLFSGAVDMDRGFFDHLPELDESTQSLGEYVQKLDRTERLILDASQQYQDKVAADNLAQRQVAEHTEFPIGSCVMLRYPKTRMGERAPTKGHMPLKGPFRVVAIHDDGRKYDIRNLVNNEIYRFQINRLVPFEVDERREDPYEIAMRDHQEFIVEEILDHQGTARDRYNLKFLVRWAGYEDPTWEPYSQIREVAALHEYLNIHRMRTLIPSRFK